MRDGHQLQRALQTCIREELQSSVGWIINSSWAVEFPVWKGIGGTAREASAGWFFGSEPEQLVSKVQSSSAAAPFAWGPFQRS